MGTEHTTLPCTLQELQELVTAIEADFGFEYSIDDGLAALARLRALVGGEPHSNVS